jgi:hypothetical protein
MTSVAALTCMAAPGDAASMHSHAHAASAQHAAASHPPGSVRADRLADKAEKAASIGQASVDRATLSTARSNDAIEHGTAQSAVAALGAATRAEQHAGNVAATADAAVARLRNEISANRTLLRKDLATLHDDPGSRALRTHAATLSTRLAQERQALAPAVSLAETDRGSLRGVRATRNDLSLAVTADRKQIIATRHVVLVDRNTYRRELAHIHAETADIRSDFPVIHHGSGGSGQTNGAPPPTSQGAGSGGAGSGTGTTTASGGTASGSAGAGATGSGGTLSGPGGGLAGGATSQTGNAQAALTGSALARADQPSPSCRPDWYGRLGPQLPGYISCGGQYQYVNGHDQP